MESTILRDSAESLLMPGVAGGCSVRRRDCFFDFQWWELGVCGGYSCGYSDCTGGAIVVRLLEVSVLEVRVGMVVGVLVVSSSLCTL